MSLGSLKIIHIWRAMAQWTHLCSSELQSSATAHRLLRLEKKVLLPVNTQSWGVYLECKWKPAFSGRASCLVKEQVCRICRVASLSHLFTDFCKVMLVKPKQEAEPLRTIWITELIHRRAEEWLKKGVQVYRWAAAVLQWEDYLVNSSKQTNRRSCGELDGPCKGCMFSLNPRGPT